MNIHKFRSYLLEDYFSMNVLKDTIKIENYTEVGHFDNNKIIIKYIDGEVTIKGKNLIISKLMNDSILIKGTIQNIELR
ncbi:MAG: YabP/YqfC family sporulation protein [Bacilli bacterium]|nr:YabP/YqfC family sporulation protein [Bacilli bacterium]